MNKIITIINKYHKSILKDKEVKRNIKVIETELAKYKFKFKIKNDLDYFKAYIMYQGIINKSIIEDLYEENRFAMLDIWDTLDYNQKNAFSKQAIMKRSDLIKSFTYNNVTILVPFFDELINKLYKDEIAVRELPQFFKLSNDFKELAQDINQYFPNVYLSDFLNTINIGVLKGYAIVFAQENKHLYILNQEGYTCLFYDGDLKYAFEFVRLYLEKDVVGMIDYIQEYQLYNEKIRNKLMKYRKKVVK